jgi:hypothetical protein
VIQLDFIRAKCLATASWRNSLIARYPHDAARNTAARDLMQMLARETDESISPEVKERLAKFGGADFTKACTDSCRLAGFRYLPLTLGDIVIDVIARLEAPANAEAVQ